MYAPKRADMDTTRKRLHQLGYDLDDGPLAWFVRTYNIDRVPASALDSIVERCVRTVENDPSTTELLLTNVR